MNDHQYTKVYKFIYLWVTFTIACITSLKAGSDIEIPFVSVNGLIIVEASVDNTMGNFILDTGSEAILINTPQVSTADNEDLLSTLHGAVSASPLKIKEVEVGGVTWQDVPAFTTDLQVVERGLNISLTGIIGFQLFEARILEIDYLEGVVKISNEIPIESLSPQNHLKFSLKDALPVAEVMVNGQMYSFLMDSGASIHFIDMEVAATLEERFIKTNTFSKVRTLSDDQMVTEIIRSSDNFHPSLTGKEFLLHDFSEMRLSDDTRIVGILSLSYLSSRIVFDVEKGEIYF